MATYKEEAIVLRAYDLGEADRIISLITAGRGLRRAVAKGVKRTSSKFGARLEPFTHMQAVLHAGRNLDTVIQVEILNSHSPIREDFSKFLFGEAMLEMIDKSLYENQDIPRLFTALCISLGVLEGKVVNPALLLAAFDLKVCALIGYHPHLDECLRCERYVGREKVSMDLAGGGIVCEGCSRGLDLPITLSADALTLIRRLLKTDMAAISGWGGNPRLSREVLFTSFRFSEYFLESPLRSRQVILRYLEGAGRQTGNNR